MARTTKPAAAAAPEPGNNPAAIAAMNSEQLSQAITRKQPAAPRNGAMKVARIDPAKLASMTPAELKAALQAATVKTVKPARVARPRVILTPDAAAAFQELGWSLPFADTDRTYQPKPRERFNNSKGSAAYTLAVAALEAGPLSLSTLAQLWLASGNPTKKHEQITEQLAIRAQRPVRQIGDRLQLITA